MTPPDKEKALARLERLKALRERGAARFILLYGGAGCGGGMALFFSLAMALFAGVPFLKVFGLSLLAWPILGLLFGAQMWWLLGRGLDRVDHMFAQQKAEAARAETDHSSRLNRLARLKQLHDSGAIDDATYEHERKALLDHR